MTRKTETERPSTRGDAPSGRVRAPRPRLSRSGILGAAFELSEAGGLPALTIRRLAAALGCEAMSIYHHFPSKQHVLDAMVEHAIAGVREPDFEAEPIERLAFLGREIRAMALRHPWLFHSIALHGLETPAGVAFVDRIQGHFHAAIPDEHVAAQAFLVFRYYVIGAALDATSPDAPFELGFAMMLKGIAALRVRVLAPRAAIPKPVIRPKA